MFDVDEFDAQMQGYVAQLGSDRDVAVRAARNEDLSEVAQTRAQSQADALRWAVSYLHTWTRGRYGQPLAAQPDWRVMAGDDEEPPLAGLAGVDEDGNSTCW